MSFDFSSVLANLQGNDLVPVIIGAGLVMVGIGFAKWAVWCVGNFFK